jgi:hypothetical protein
MFNCKNGKSADESSADFLRESFNTLLIIHKTFIIFD